MTKSSEEPGTGEIPSRVFEAFFAELKAAEVDPEIIERLRAKILVEKSLAEKSIRTAIFGNE